MALSSRLTVSKDDGLTLTYRIHNDGTTPVELTFRSGQHVEFAAYPQSTVSPSTTQEPPAVSMATWYWSADRLFTQAIEQLSLAPDDTREWHGTWSAPTSGSYTVAGWLLSEQPIPAFRTVTIE